MNSSFHMFIATCLYLRHKEGIRSPRKIREKSEDIYVKSLVVRNQEIGPSVWFLPIARFNAHDSIRSERIPYLIEDFPIETMKNFRHKRQMPRPQRHSSEAFLMILAVPRARHPVSIYRYGTTRTPIEDIQRERRTSLEHIMVGTEYGMAPEMTHGPAAGLRVLH